MAGQQQMMGNVTFMLILCTGYLFVTASPHKSYGLSQHFYHKSCPKAASIVEQVVVQAVQKEARMAASLLRLHFHDCFVNGCDGSILLDDTSTAIGEKTSPPNNNSVRGFEVVDDIKAALEAACPATVSCADILALAANVSVAQVGGPSWTVRLGRRDSTTANFSAPSQFLPGFSENISAIVNKFAVVGLSVRDTVVLSGGHSIGDASCSTFKTRLYNFSGTGKPDPTMDSGYLALLTSRCPEADDTAAVFNALDVTTPQTFDNKYYSNLVSGEGLLQSDQELYSNSIADGFESVYELVKKYSKSESAFFSAFGKSMIKMGNISPLLGPDEGEIRLNCRKANS